MCVHVSTRVARFVSRAKFPGEICRLGCFFFFFHSPRLFGCANKTRETRARINIGHRGDERQRESSELHTRGTREPFARDESVTTDSALISLGVGARARAHTIRGGRSITRGFISVVLYVRVSLSRSFPRLLPLLLASARVHP